MDESPTNRPDPRVIDNAQSPTVYFDNVTTFGTTHGVINVALVTRTLIAGTQAPISVWVTSGQLKCSAVAARALRDALNDALALLEKPTVEPQSGSITLQ